MARTRISKTVTVGDIKFKPVTGRERSASDGLERYWQARRYVGIVADKPQRLQVWRGWARADQLAGIAANLVGSEASQTRTSAGRGPATLDELRAGNVELLVRAWRAARKGDRDYSEFTRRNDRTIAKRLIKVIGPLRLLDVDGPRTGEHLRVQLRKEYATSTVRSTLTIFVSIWNKWALRRGIVDKSIDLSASYKRLREAEKRGEDTGTRDKPTPTEDEAWAIVDALDASAPAWAALAFRILLMTGGRIGEIAVLVWDDVGNGSVRLRGKTGPRDVEVDPRALAAVLGSRQQGLPGTDRILPVVATTVRTRLAKYIDRACIDAGVPRITPHSLRRFAVQRYIRAGVLPSVAAEQLGHTPEVMMRYYEQVQPSDKRAAARKAALGVRPATDTGKNVVKIGRQTA